MAGDIYSQASIAVGDAWSPRFGTANIDKIDVTTHGGAVLVQFEHENRWSPPQGVYIAADLFSSIVGLSDIYPPGPTGVRFQRARQGAAATVDFTAYSVQ